MGLEINTLKYTCSLGFAVKFQITWKINNRNLWKEQVLTDQYLWCCKVLFVRKDVGKVINIFELFLKSPIAAAIHTYRRVQKYSKRYKIDFNVRRPRETAPVDLFGITDAFVFVSPNECVTVRGAPPTEYSRLRCTPAGRFFHPNRSLRQFYRLRARPGSSFVLRLVSTWSRRVTWILPLIRSISPSDLRFAFSFSLSLSFSTSRPLCSLTLDKLLLKFQSRPSQRRSANTFTCIFADLIFFLKKTLQFSHFFRFSVAFITKLFRNMLLAAKVVLFSFCR